MRSTRCATVSVNSGLAFVLTHDERGAHVTPSGTEQAYTWMVLRRV